MRVDLDDESVDRYVVVRRTYTSAGCAEQVLAVLDQRDAFQRHLRASTRSLRREQRRGTADARDCIGGSVLLSPALVAASGPAVSIALRQRRPVLPHLRAP